MGSFFEKREMVRGKEEIRECTNLRRDKDVSTFVFDTEITQRLHRITQVYTHA